MSKYGSNSGWPSANGEVRRQRHIETARAQEGREPDGWVAREGLAERYMRASAEAKRMRRLALWLIGGMALALLGALAVAVWL